MKVGFCTVNYSDWKLDDVIKLAAGKGYEAVEIPSYTDNGQTDPDELIKDGGAGAKKLKEGIEGQGLSISAISNHLDTMAILCEGDDINHIYDGTPEEQHAFGAASLIRSLQIASAMEVPVVIAFTGLKSLSHMNAFPYGRGWEDEEKVFVERFSPLLDKCKEYGVKLAIEAHPNNIIYDLHTARKAVNLVDGHPNFGINFDPANILYTGVSVDAFVDEMKDRIFSVHAKDCQILSHNMPRGGWWMYQGDWNAIDRSFRFRIPGWGSIDWKSLITELFLVGFDGVFSYEHEDVTMSRDDGTDKTIDFLKPLMIHAPYEGRKDKLFAK
ncbi:MAG: sugar phosphate isomerase/epimerase [Clostridiales Family XIII bacterium]|jgi:sugar phosphate isomerase/epimerase|nr:sugar phosphate isomerase/epimerase [Clostridiales Family XIII bacterium]